MDGHTFASKREAERYAELRLLGKAGEIEALELQPKFLLYVIPYKPPYRRIDVGVYIADFSYIEKDEMVVEDVKSPATRTPLYRLKKKMVEALYGIMVRET